MLQHMTIEDRERLRAITSQQTALSIARKQVLIEGFWNGAEQFCKTHKDLLPSNAVYAYILGKTYTINGYLKSPWAASLIALGHDKRAVNLGFNGSIFNEYSPSSVNKNLEFLVTAPIILETELIEIGLLPKDTRTLGY